ncbi:hypothetical protein VPH35_118791 [Triticum aestivum]
MNPLIGKLTTLMGDEYKKLKGVRKEVAFLKDELSAMNASLEKLEFMEKLEPNTKNWRDHVREMAYDMENCIDDFMQDIGGANANASAGFVKRMSRRLKTLRVRHRIAGQIEELKARAVEANERRIRYKIDDCNTSCGSVDIDPRISVIYKDAAALVGTDGPKMEVVSLLTVTEKKLKVVSIVGFGGLGKTTLSNQVYNDLDGQFDCKAFIPVSQKPDMPRLLNSLRLKLGINDSSGICEVQGIIDQLREHLANKRYFIIVDDLWDEEAWDIIRCAFPENGNGSRVIVTTRVEAVAISACSYHYEHIYKMKPLIFGSENKCPSNFEEVSNEILKKCGGLPLAIITIASLLASRRERSRNDWENIQNSLGAQFAINPTLKGMRNILNLSYMNLPLHLRTCFLYLGMYPEDYEIMRDDLVRKWIAEGFVSNSHGKNLEDVGISYFNELVNRSLIQPAIDRLGRVCYKVHDMMLDLILSKCAEDNFNKKQIFRNGGSTSEEMTRPTNCTYMIRRLSLISAIDRTSETLSWTVSDSTSQLRSLVWFGDCRSISRLIQLKYIRVLSFENSYLPWGSHLDLTAISQLFQLRYLKVSDDCYAKLPTEIQGLVHLDTLDVGYGSIPSDIEH